MPTRKPYTDAIYNSAMPHWIPNCSSLMSKCPRFPYKAFTKDDLEDLLCRCGLENPCECPIDEEKEIVCQAKVRRRLFKGLPPRLNEEGQSCPSTGDHGFDVNADGSMRRLLDLPKNACPPYYNANVNEYTTFYQGCKWSMRTSQRSTKSYEVRPGPADYNLEREITPQEKCYQMVRAYRRKMAKLGSSMETSKGPGPADYSPQLPKGPEINFFGPKAQRFPISQHEVRPSPNTYLVKRDFDPPNIPFSPRYSQLPLPPPAGFGSKDTRLKYRTAFGPGPADYDANVKLCNITHCGNLNAPFNYSAKRFQDTKIDYEDEYDDEECNEIDSDGEDRPPQLLKARECPQLMSQFKSKTPRFKPIFKKLNKPSPANFGLDLIKKTHKENTALKQKLAPFLSSQGRFQPWHNSIAVHNVDSTPGPGYYNFDKFKCCPAVRCGPLLRSPRFRNRENGMPAPNEYNVTRGVNDVLSTCNRKLLDNIEKQHKFHWKLPVERTQFDFKHRELAILNKAIANLSTSDFMRGPNDPKPEPVKKGPKTQEQKILRSFLYKKQVQHIV